MSVSYGTITITDSTDLGQLTAYLTSDKYKQQTLDTNTGNYFPDWIAGNSWITFTPHIFYNGDEVDLTVQGSSSQVLNPQLEITWYEDGTNISTNPSASTTATVLNNNTCKRTANLSTSDRNVIYQIDIKYYPVLLPSGQPDTSLYLVSNAEIELSLNMTGKNANDPKSLQLTTNRGYFTYRYDDTIYGERTATITATRSSTVKGIVWYYTNSSGVETALPNSLVTNGGNSSQFTGDSITISTLNSWNNTLFDALKTRGQITFTVKETTANGGTTLVTGGFTDSVSIMYYKEASPGDSVYISSLDNNEETLSVYNDILDLTGATSRLFINKDGRDDSNNWHISLSDNVVTASEFVYVGWSSKDYPDGIYKGVSSTVISNNGTQAPTINGVEIPTSSLSANNVVVYNTAAYCWNGSKWVLSTTNLAKYGPDCVAVTSLEVNSAAITFLAEHGTYDGSTFTRDEAAADLRNIFTVVKSASVISHSLRISAVNINRDANGNYTPSSITLDAITRTGGSSSPTPYRDAGVINYTINYADSTSSSGSNTADSAVNLSLSSITNEITRIDVTLGSTSPYEDTQTIVVSNDGSSPFNINVPNQTDTISTTFDYYPNAAFTIDVPFLVMRGLDEIGVHKYVNTSTAYPRVKVGVIYKIVGSTTSSTGITPTFYNNNSTATDITNRVKATLPVGTNIGNSGYFELTFELSSSISKVVRYTYASSPEALSPLFAQLYPNPGNTFVNQTGKIVITPVVNSGITEVTENLIYLWEIYDGTWKTIRNTTSAVSTDYYNAGIFFASSSSATTAPTDISNGTANSKYLHVKGTAVNGYVALRMTTTYSTTGASVTEYISLVDKDDPIQVTILSTVGDKLTNGQGTGALYVRVVMNQDELDAIKTPLTFTNTAPVNASSYPNMMGCIVKPTNSNTISYYYRETSGGNWVLRQSTRCIYEWTFRDQDNVPILSSENTYLNSIITNNTNTQFIYIDRSVINNKLTADVKVTVNPIES